MADQTSIQNHCAANHGNCGSTFHFLFFGAAPVLFGGWTGLSAAWNWNSDAAVSTYVGVRSCSVWCGRHRIPDVSLCGNGLHWPESPGGKVVNQQQKEPEAQKCLRFFYCKAKEKCPWPQRD